MSRATIIKTAAAIWLTALVMDNASAQLPPWAQAGSGKPVQLTGGIQPALLPAQSQANTVPVMHHAPRVTAGRPIAGATPIHECYPHTGAALYPSPIPNVPYQVGATLHTNQAFYPHEMLYPHRYTAMYPPFYYVVNGGWMVTPWGVRSNDVWKLEGTRVNVKYKSKWGLFSGFHGIKHYDPHSR